MFLRILVARLGHEEHPILVACLHLLKLAQQLAQVRLSFTILQTLHSSGCSSNGMCYMASHGCAAVDASRHSSGHSTRSGHRLGLKRLGHIL